MMYVLVSFKKPILYAGDVEPLENMGAVLLLSRKWLLLGNYCMLQRSLNQLIPYYVGYAVWIAVLLFVE